MGAGSGGGLRPPPEWVELLRLPLPLTLGLSSADVAPLFAGALRPVAERALRALRASPLLPVRVAATLAYRYTALVDGALACPSDGWLEASMDVAFRPPGSLDELLGACCPRARVFCALSGPPRLEGPPPPRLPPRRSERTRTRCTSLAHTAPPPLSSAPSPFQSTQTACWTPPSAPRRRRWATRA